jgi:hypothetical protein
MSGLQDDLEQIRDAIHDLSLGCSMSALVAEEAQEALDRVAAVVLSGDETQNEENDLIRHIGEGESASALEVQAGEGSAS